MIVYKATNKINGRVYIGITIHTLKLRRQQHINEANIQRNNMPICKAIRKYGIENFEWEVIDTGKTRKELEEKERYYIELYDSYHNGYNATLGGEGVVGAKLSDEAREKMSEAKRGPNNPWYGRKGVNAGKKMSEEQKLKLSIAHKGKKPKPPTEETLQKRRLSQQGEKGSGAKLSEKDVLKIRDLYASGRYTQKELSERYGLIRQSISDIVLRKTWKHI